MKRIGFTVVTLLIIGLLGYGGYYAIASLKDPKTYIPVNSEKIGDIHRVATSTDDVAVRSVYEQKPVISTDSATATATTTTTSHEGTDLQTRLQALITQKIVLKKGSKGDAVKTIQEFMNQYFKSNYKIDGDFGKTLETNVKKFQTANKITATGQVASKTMQAMVDWLAKQ